MLIVLGVILRARSDKRWKRGICFVVAFVGLLFVLLSSPPMYMVTLLLLSVGTLAACSDRVRFKWPRVLPVICLCWVAVCLLELPRLVMPQLSLHTAEQSLPVVVIADSMTAGLGEGEATNWPTLLGREYSGDVLDISHVGETVSSATKRAAGHELPDECVVIVELGGNDIFGGTDVDQFETDLDRFLTQVATKRRSVFMFELPLPPFHNRWGRIQRELAARHGAALIPKRQLAWVLAGKSSTLDSIHLSQEGHDRMLQIVRYLLRI